MIRFAARTDPGKRDGENQDAVGADPERATWFVADGMGGHAAGGIASGIVKRTILELAGSVPLKEAILQAHRAIAADAARDPKHEGMGSTVIAAQLKGSTCTIAWVGDSRAYLWRQDRLQPLSKDHSLVEGLREQHLLSDTQARVHPNRHMVTQTLGLGDPVPSRNDVRLRPGDHILLCSDGLNGELSDADIATVLRAHPLLEGAANALIATALDHGGNDNVSVVLVAYEGRSKAERGPFLQNRKGVLLLVLLAAAAAVALGALWWLMYAGN